MFLCRLVVVKEVHVAISSSDEFLVHIFWITVIKYRRVMTYLYLIAKKTLQLLCENAPKCTILKF